MTAKPDKPRRPTLDLAATRAAMGAIAEVNRGTAASLARTQHSTLAEAGHMAALAADKLQQGISKPEDLEAVISLLRKIEAAAQETFTKARGSKDDYQDIGQKVLKRLVTLGGKLRR
jgi:hypothetical protein